MINWELPHDKVPCPHCGSTETQLSLQLLGLIRFTCSTCRKSFATHGDDKNPKPNSPHASASHS